MTPKRPLTHNSLAYLLQGINMGLNMPRPDSVSVYDIPFPSSQSIPTPNLLTTTNHLDDILSQEQSIPLDIAQYKIYWGALAIGLHHRDTMGIMLSIWCVHFKLNAQQIACCFALAYTMAYITAHEDEGMMLHHIAQQVYHISQEFDSHLLRIGHVLAWTSVQKSLRHLGQGKSPSEIFCISYYVTLRYQDDCIGALSCAHHQPHNARLIASLVGALWANKYRDLMPPPSLHIIALAEHFSQMITIVTQ